MSRVMVGMSGGVDSSVAALLLHRAGYEVVGATMKLISEKGTEPFSGPESPAEKGSVPFSENLCCSWEAVERARHVCEVIGIRHYVLNVTEAFRREVIEHFVAEYRRGRTPNPCLRCNEIIKWGEMLRRARGLQCEHIATGHYARVEAGEDGRWRLRRGVDRGKDQSYALYMLSQEELEHTLLPLGGLRKEEVRRLATEAGLPSAQTRESQDICFVPQGDYRVLFGAEAMQPGPIVDRGRRELGRHRGLPAYTVGQRKGLGVAAGEPLYVLGKDIASNALVVGTREEAVRRMLTVEETNWIAIAPPKSGTLLEAEVEMRYRGKPVPGTVLALADGRAEVLLGPTDQIAAPGQSAVFYRGDEVLGGGVIGE